MTDYILVHGDTVKFNTDFVPADVVVRPGTLTGTGDATFQDKKLCVEGDETKVSVPCIYTVKGFPKPGSGALKIEELHSDQIAQKTFSSKKAVLLKGSQFKAKFEVQSPAQNPSAGATDPNTAYLGSGVFETSNSKWQGT